MEPRCQQGGGAGSRPVTEARGYRAVTLFVAGQPTSDGAGVKLTRVIGTPELGQLDPFLLLDEFRSDRPQDYIGGFPDHPHRGFETVTYMLAGRMRHRDSTGHEGVIEAGGVQWMTAGRGVIHSEMPEQEDGLLWGFQLWLNLPAAEKMKAPSYQEFADVAEEALDGGGTVRVIAGKTGRGTEGPVGGITTDPLYLDVTLPAGASFEEAIPAAANAFVYVYDGGLAVGGGNPLSRGILGVLGEGERVKARAGADGARFRLLAARPLGEPVARGGPFVMNTREEVQQAFRDFGDGSFLQAD